MFDFIKMNKSVSGQDITGHFGISRQAANKHIKALLIEGKIIKEGVTRGARYRPADTAGRAARSRVIQKKYALSGLEEHETFNRISTLLNLESYVSSAAYAIIRHAFTEMLNNAIDHSMSESCVISFDLDQYRCSFTVRDFGIGIFYSICSKFGLKDEHDALGQLLKGKITTMEERHSGEGVFFTSKAGDRMSIRSHRIRIEFDNIRGDVIVEEKRFIKGTEISFSISRRSKRDLSSIFREYSPEMFDFRFERTRVRVNLMIDEYISRSEAKRLLFGLDKFREIILDFRKVKAIGQGFADEVFRVFPRENPGTVIKPVNENQAIAQMIRHVVDK